MGLVNWIFDFYQHSKIDRAKRETEALRAELSTLRNGAGGGIDQERIVDAIGQLALAVKTMQRVLLEKGLVTDRELRAKAYEIDGEDGRIDGRAAP